MSVPEFYSDLYVERLSTAVSFALGLNEAGSIARDTHFIRSVCIVVLLVFVASYVQLKAVVYREYHHGYFALFWRFVHRVASFVQQFATVLFINALTIKLTLSETLGGNLLFSIRLLLYCSFAMLFIVIIMLIEHHFLRSGAVFNFGKQQLPRSAGSDRCTPGTDHGERCRGADESNNGKNK